MGMMFNRTVLNRLLLATAISFPAIACASGTSLQQQAQDFCAIHHAESWQHTAPETSTQALSNASWAGPEYLDFHAVSFVRVDRDAADAAQHEIEIQVTDQHAYVLGGQAYPTITAQALLSALGDVDPVGSRIRVILDDGASDEALPAIFNAAEALGITSIIVISD